MELSQIMLYQPGSAAMDYLLLEWLEEMRSSGELSKTMAECAHTPLAFLESFQTPRRLALRIDHDTNRIAAACWVEPCMGSIWLAYYIAPNLRDSKERVYFLYDCIDLVFSQGVPVVCGFIQDRPTPAKTAQFLELHERLGYRYVGKMTRFFDGKDCHIVEMTRESWEDNDSRFKREWLRSRQEGTS